MGLRAGYSFASDNLTVKIEGSMFNKGKKAETGTTQKDPHEYATSIFGSIKYAF